MPQPPFVGEDDCRSSPPHDVSTEYSLPSSSSGAALRTSLATANCLCSAAVSLANSFRQSTTAVCDQMVSICSPCRNATVPVDITDRSAPVQTTVLTYPLGTVLSYSSSGETDSEISLSFPLIRSTFASGAVRDASSSTTVSQHGHGCLSSFTEQDGRSRSAVAAHVIALFVVMIICPCFLAGRAESDRHTSGTVSGTDRTRLRARP